jgi:hypothetical protein
MKLFPSRSALLDCALGIVPVLIFALAIRSGAPRPSSEQLIRVATAQLPPQMNSKGEGQEAKIIIAALRAGGVKADIVFDAMPFTRHWKAFAANNRYAAVTTVPEELKLDGLRSKVYVNYQNGIFYKTAAFPNGLGKDALTALSNRKVVAFAGAATILPGVRSASHSSIEYLEQKDQQSHTVLFVNDKVDLVIADELIFAQYTREYLGADYAKTADATAFDPVFCPTPYHLVFREDSLRDAFDAGLASIRSDGTLDDIEKTYATGTGITKVSRQNQGC